MSVTLTFLGAVLAAAPPQAQKGQWVVISVGKPAYRFQR